MKMRMDGEVEKELIKNYIADEFKDASFGDKRLNKRFFKIATDLGSSCEMPINQACEDVASTKAAYRFFANDKVKAEAILAPHQAQTQNRMQNETVVLAIQDTMYLDYTNHLSKIGLGPIGTDKQNLTGLVVHTTLITTLKGLPIGKLTQQIWTRDENDKQKAKSRRKTSIKDKESQKWLDALDETMRLTPASVEAITVCDRESDIYEFFQAAYELQAHVLVRSAQNRKLDEEDEKLWNYMDERPVDKRITIEVPPKDKTPARNAQLEIRYGLVDIKKPLHGSASDFEWITLTAIWVKELNQPQGVKGIRWMLLTNLPVESTHDALKCIEWYKLRWRIEDYHKVIKSGCCVEDCRLETKERIIRYFTLMSIVAWRLFWMTHINRIAGETPCNAVVTENEWKALYCKIHKTKTLPPNIPTTYEVIRWIARLGGFLGRKNDGEPGMVTIWRGWRRLTDIVDTWSIFNAP